MQILATRKISFFIFLLCGILYHSCQTTRDSPIDKTINDYLAVYSSRQDFERFLNFYEEEVVLEDMISGERLVGKEKLRGFFDWNNPAFESLSEKNLVVTRKVVDGSAAVVMGYFEPFKWNQLKVDRMHFTTILVFNASEKIIRQTDWINYPSTIIEYGKKRIPVPNE